MRTKAMRILWLFTLAGILGACKKDRLVDPVTDPTLDAPGNVAASDIRDFFEKHEVKCQSFTLDAASYQNITGEKGTKLMFWPNSFVTENDMPVTGSVELCLKEIYDKADMILSNKPTMANDGILVSSGEIFISATQNGQKLKLAGGKYISADFVTDNGSEPMQLFSGIENVDGDVVWILNDTTDAETCYDSLQIALSYCIDLPEMNWSNCDYYYSDPRPLTDVEFEVPVNHNDTNTAIFIVPDNENIVIGLTEFYGNIFSAASSYELPIGLTVTVVGIAEVNGQLYSSFTPTTITSNHFEVVSFTATTESQFLADLQTLL